MAFVLDVRKDSGTESVVDVKIAVGNVVKVLLDEPESRLYGMHGMGTIATVTQIFPHDTIEIESVAGIRQFYPKGELEILPVM